MPATFNERPHQNEKAEALAYVRRLMEQARKESNHEDLPKLEKLLELIDSKRYGLVWEEHAELVEEEMKTKIPVFVEDETRKIQGNPESEDYNFLLEGDNLHSLYLLQKTHVGKIDVIYIDPPYNTGNKDFIYNDKIVDKTDGYSHSKWLSFMSKRLELAKELLSETGVIFISIDDNEQAQLKLLCDEIFGEDNFIGTFIVNTTPNGRDYGAMAKQHEYSLMYSKKISKVHFNKIKDEEKKFKYKDNIGEFNIHPLYNSNVAFTPANRPNLHYPFYVQPNTKDENGFYKIALVKSEGSIEIYPPKSMKGDAQFVWRWGKVKSEANINVEIVGYKVNGEFRIVQKMRGDSKIIRSLLIDKKYSTRTGTSELEKILGYKSFVYPKTVNLLKIFLQASTYSNSIVLDFFAGSGTTGHAVAQLNKEDGGNRKYILCTNNENKICEEVTYKRLSNIQEELPHNLKYFKTRFIEKEDEELEYSLLNNVKTLIELEHAIDLSESDKAVAFSLSAIRELDLTEIKTVYVRQHSHALMDKEDLVRYEGIELIDVPEYYFSKEMREAGL